MGLTDYLRDIATTNDAVDHCSGAYSGGESAGSKSALAAGAGRLAYAGLAKGYSAYAVSGAAASAGRSTLRTAFGGGKSLRPPNVSKYGSDDAALRAAAERTNPYANAAGAGAVAGNAGGGYDGSDGCGCSD